jgi:uncharacterized membrane protein
MTNKNSKVEAVISRVLQIGVLISSIVIIIGLYIFFTHNNSLILNKGSYHKFTSSSYYFPRNLSDLKQSIMSGEGIGIMTLGIFLLIMTPLLRVATSILLFIKQKDKPMTVITFLVLLILVSSFYIGIKIK